MSESDNIPEVIAAVQAYQQAADVALSVAAGEIALRLEREAKLQIKGDRRNEPGKATPDMPPMNRTGNLRRSIAGTMRRVGFGQYESVVGAYMEYARTVETGQPAPPSWRDGQKFPFLEPAVNKFVAQNNVERIIVKHLRGIR